MIKDASFYIKRIKDLPSSLVEVIRELYKEVSSHRFICISMQELCQKLELDYTEKSFEDNCQKNYVCINTYLEMLGLKLVPCSIPVDLSFPPAIVPAVIPRNSFIDFFHCSKRL